MDPVTVCDEIDTTVENVMSDFKENGAKLQEGSQSSVGQAICIMTESNGSCFDPKNYHSFHSVSILLPLRTCAVCSQRLQSVVSFSSDKVVQCLACKMLAHRSCALSDATIWKEPCPVNYKILHVMGEESEPSSTPHELRDTSIASDAIQEDQSEKNSLAHPNAANENHDSSLQSQVDPQNCMRDDKKCRPALQDRLSVFRVPTMAQGENSSKGTSDESNLRLVSSEGACIGSGSHDGRSYSKATFPFMSDSRLLVAKSSPICVSKLGDPPGGNIDSVITKSHSWNGSSFLTDSASEGQGFVLSCRPNGDGPIALGEFWERMERQPQVDVELESYSDPVFSQALEWTIDGPPAHWATEKSLEVIFPSASFPHSPDVSLDSSSEEDSPLHFAIHSFTNVSRALHENILAHFRPVAEHVVVQDEDASTEKQDRSEHTPDASDELLAKVSQTTPDTQDEGNTEVEGSTEESKTPAADHRRLGLATVAGGIAGGVAGLVVAGPMGGVIGVKFGQTAGILGVVLEGSFTIGVITSGIAAGRHAGQQLQDKIDEKRVLTLSGTGTNNGILLVRPSVRTDPKWAEFCEEAKKSHKKGRSFNFLSSDYKAGKRERYEREFDIVKADDMEIPTVDKVLLLVSRILNNKKSLPGHVYRQLIEKLKERAESRGPLTDMIKATNSQDDQEPVEEFALDWIRGRRQDAHAVIKYVTAAILELRPEFAASSSITEYTATAVEGLVFGEIYDMVIEEIEAEFEEKDNELLEKLSAFEQSCSLGASELPSYKTCTSQEALAALHRLPEAHSAVDKLGYCVEFLEEISDFFSSEGNSANNTLMGADSLLKLVCQHILVAKVFGIYAQIAFIDEFARDEQLLRGKEGYALVTLQASLHFLNASSDFKAEIFDQDDD